MSKIPNSIPKLEIGQLPKGIPGLSPVQPLNPRCKRVSSEFSANSEFADAPQTDIVSNGRPQLHTSRPEFSGYSMSWETTSAKTFRPPEPSPPTDLKRNGRDRWIRLDREVLRFFMYFKESVPESPLEHYRVRKCVLFFFLATDMIQITEPKVPNSGIPQGSFLQKTSINHFVNSKHETLSLKDLAVGENLNFFGRVFHVVDCDNKTRKFYAEELGVLQGAAEEYPLDPISLKLKKTEEHEQNGQLAAARKKHDTLGKFLKYGKQALRISACWDDSKAVYGEKRYFNVIYYLCDDTIEISEKYTANCGRERFPKFLSRTKVLKTDNPGSEDYYSERDLILGTTIDINKRPFLLLNCDATTRAFYEEIGIKQIPVIEDKKPKVLPRMKPPPYNGFGSEADSLGSFYNLVPKAPKQNHSKAYKYGTQALRIKVELITDAPQEKGRQFVIIFFLGDETLSIFEPPQRNTGIAGGKFLERRQYINKLTGKRFLKEDFETAIKEDTTICILKRDFKILSPDKFTKDFFGMKPKNALMKDALENLFLRVIQQGLRSQGNLRNAFTNNNKDFTTISLDGFRNVISSFGLEVTTQEIDAVSQNFEDVRSHDIFYGDFCDEVANRLKVDETRSTAGNRFKGIETVILDKLCAHSVFTIRKLFRKIDQERSGSLTFSELNQLLSCHSLSFLPYELAEIMSRYDSDRTGKFDYNQFCDKFYECDFGNLLGATVVTKEGQVDAEEFLRKLESHDEGTKKQNDYDNVLAKFCDSFRQRRYELRKAFRNIDKSKDGKLSMEEFIQGCDEVNHLSDEDKYLLSKVFFPKGIDKIDYDALLDSIFEATSKSFALPVNA